MTTTDPALARLAAAVERIADALERIADARQPPAPMLESLRIAFGAAGFTASEAVALAAAQAAEAAALGQAPDGLTAALAAERIRTPHALDRRLAKLGVARGLREGGGTVCHVQTKTPKNIKALFAASQTGDSVSDEITEHKIP